MKRKIIISISLIIIFLSQTVDRILFIKFDLMESIILIFTVLVIVLLKEKKFLKEIYDGITIIIVTLMFVQVISMSLISYVIVEGISMESTYHDGDIVLIEYSDNIERFDVVVIEMEGTYFLKRVIGLPNENIKYIDNKLYVDNVKIEEEFTKGTTCINTCEYITKEGEYFLLGDNRDNSFDSRDKNFSNKGGDAIIGKIYNEFKI